MRQETVAIHRAEDLGAPYDVVLVASVLTDGESYTIPHLEGLIGAVVMGRLWRDERLTGKELSYLRRSVGIDREVLGAAMGGTHADIEAYEEGPRPMTLATEKYIRLHLFNAARRMDGPRVDEMMNYLDWTFDEWKPTYAEVGRPIEVRLRHFPTGWQEIRET